jgi:hypothetical protein
MKLANDDPVLSPPPAVDAESLPEAYCDRDRRFAIIGTPTCEIRQILRMDEFSAANAYVTGQITASEDLFAAIRFFHQQKPSFILERLFSLSARATAVARAVLAGRNATAHNIRFRYAPPPFTVRRGR